MPGEQVLLELRFRQADHEAFVVCRDNDLAGEATVGFDAQGAIQHRFLVLVLGLYLAFPCRVDITVAGGAGTGATAVTDDAGNQVLDGVLHHALAHGGIDHVFFTVVFNVDNLGHDDQALVAVKG